MRVVLWCLVACVALLQPSNAHAIVAVETNDLLTFEYQQTGANEEEAVRLAGIRAVNATVGRLLHSDFSLRARDILDDYIGKNWQKFVASSYVLERRFERDGFGCRIRVQTFPEHLHRDLFDKRFLYLPRPNPYHYVFLAESVNNQFVAAGTARASVIAAIAAEGRKVYESGVQSPPDSVDIMSQEALFSAAREAASKVGAEIIVSGRADTTKVAEEEVYYDVMHTYETKVHLDMIRADDGTIVASADAVERSSDRDPQVARLTAVGSAADQAGTDLLRASTGVWRQKVLEETKYSVMFTDLRPEEIENVARHLELQLGHGSRVILRNYYGGVAILGVDTERAYAALERAVLNFKEYDLRIADRVGNRVTVDVKH